MDASSETEAVAVSAAPETEPERAPRGAIVGPSVGRWLRHVVGLTVLSAIALSPEIWIALRVGVPANAPAAKAAVSLGWVLIGGAWFGQLVLVGGAARIERGFGAGLAQMLRVVVPCAVAAIAVAIGCLALVVPGPVLLVLLALTGASTARGLPAPLVDSIDAVRGQLGAVALAVAAMLVIDGAIGVVAHRVFVAGQLAGARDFVRAIVVALVVVSPGPACVLARLRARATASG